MYLRDFVSSRFSGPVGVEVKFTLESLGGESREVTVAPAAAEGEWSEPAGFVPSMRIDCEARREEDGIAYLRFNTFALPVMKSYRRLIKTMQPTDGLIIDLRGNSGGISLMAAGMCGWLAKRQSSLGSMKLRNSEEQLTVYPQSDVFRGPIAVLIDGASASTSEIMAGGLRGIKRARVFGQVSAGAALPSLFKQLPTGDLFQYAVGDFKTPDGQVIEGGGIVPDEVVALTREDCAAQRDSVVAAARAWLEQERAAAKQPRKGK
jgi:carboxyl-terminal processing protease